MNEKVTSMVALLFRDIHPSDEVQALHDEVLNNCQERFADLTRSGLSEDEALSAVMESLKGMDEVLQDYPKKQDIYAELNLDGDDTGVMEEEAPAKKGTHPRAFPTGGYQDHRSQPDLLRGGGRCLQR